METLSKSQQNKGRLKIVLILTLLYLAAEVVGGIVTKSLALLADAGHMLTDVGGLALSLFAIHMSSKGPSKEKSYGYYRAEILASLANSVVLIVISIYILFEAYKRFVNPPEVQSKDMLIIAAVGLVVNIIGILILRKSSGESLNMKGAYFEVLSDMLTSIGVIAAGIIMLTTGWYYADPILSAGIGLFILPRTWILLKESVSVLLEGTPKDVNVAELRSKVLDQTGVEDIYDLHVWSLTSGVNAMSAHVRITQDTEYSEVIHRLSAYVRRNFKIAHITIQLTKEERSGAPDLF